MRQHVAKPTKYQLTTDKGKIIILKHSEFVKYIQRFYKLYIYDPTRIISYYMLCDAIIWHALHDLNNKSIDCSHNDIMRGGLDPWLEFIDIDPAWFMEKFKAWGLHNIIPILHYTKRRHAIDYRHGAYELHGELVFPSCF